MNETTRPLSKDTRKNRRLGAANRDARKAPKEPVLTQIASFVELFVWLLVLKSFFLPLFIIPTGSMAETLAGAHATFTCPNCGYEYKVGFHNSKGPPIVQCPNCRVQIHSKEGRSDGAPLNVKAGDRIVVHGWTFDIGGCFGPRRWDVVVFKNPNEPAVNFIKRLIGLPGETIELIDGDVFVTLEGETTPRPARKTRQAQQALWFPYYDHDYPPKQASSDWAAREMRMARPRWPAYKPRWIACEETDAWKDLDTRAPRFIGAETRRQEIRFVTWPGDNPPPARILDVYGYNSIAREYQFVTDARISTGVAFQAGDGYVELCLSKYENMFFARLTADGDLKLERGAVDSNERTLWGETELTLHDGGAHFALGHADYRVTVEIDGKIVLESNDELYPVTAEQARQASRTFTPPDIRIAAAGVEMELTHLLIERDVHYTSGKMRGAPPNQAPGTGTQGYPVKLDNAYFMCGDNSPGSHDSRAWSEADLGPHLRAAYAEDSYSLGTVPADQMIGRAFFVYWPGFMPLSSKGINILPDLGRVRWIH